MASANVDTSSRSYSHDSSAPNSHRPARPATAPLNDLDDFSDLDAEVARALRDAEDNTNAQASTRRTSDKENNVGDGLGLDEEIKVRKPRAPIAKLDENRLLSEKGIPKLRKITKNRLRFKGKGHEFSDIGRLLNLYQLWLDDLFPKAKFADALNMIEKLGHKKRMQVWRKEWIEETKPTPRRDELSDGEADFIVRGADEMEEDDEGLFVPAERREDAQIEKNTENPEPSPNTTAGNITSNTALQEDPPEWDDLDELFAEDAVGTSTTVHDKSAIESVAPGEDEFAEEMQILAGMDDPW